MKLLDSILSFIASHHCLNCDMEGSLCCQKCLEDMADPSAGKVCYKCAEPVSDSSGICQPCRLTQSLDSISWYADYRNPATSKLIKSFKFNHLYAAHQPISSALSKLSARAGVNILTSIPTANRRVRMRGWDQAKLIAKPTANFLGLPYKSLLVRVSSFDQIGATKLERSKASKEFFRPTRKALIKQSSIILIDDVVTTGATLNSAAETLKSAGALQVHAITFARQPLIQ